MSVFSFIWLSENHFIRFSPISSGALITLVVFSLTICFFLSTTFIFSSTCLKPEKLVERQDITILRHFKFFEGCLPEILFGLLMNTLYEMKVIGMANRHDFFSMRTSLVIRDVKVYCFRFFQIKCSGVNNYL